MSVRLKAFIKLDTKTIGKIILAFGLFLFFFWVYIQIKPKPPKISLKAIEFYTIPDLEFLNFGPDEYIYEEFFPPLPTASLKYNKVIEKAKQIFPIEIIAPKSRSYYLWRIAAWKKGEPKFFAYFATKNGTFLVSIETGFDSEILGESKKLRLKNGMEIPYWATNEETIFLIKESEWEQKKFYYLLSSIELPIEKMESILYSIFSR